MGRGSSGAPTSLNSLCLEVRDNVRRIFEAGLSLRRDLAYIATENLWI